jgi:hypothetical protein
VAGPVVKGSTGLFLPFSKPGAPGDRWLLNSIDGASQPFLAAGVVSFFSFFLSLFISFK